MRYLEGEDREYCAPCWVGHGEDLEPCKRPSTVQVYGINFCPEHGEEAAFGALEEMHQDAYDFFARLACPHVPPLSNPLVREAVRRWGLSVPLGMESPDFGLQNDVIRAAYPFRADKVDGDAVYGIANPNPRNEYPTDSLRSERQATHAVIRHAFERDLTFVVEMLEPERESIAAQLSYALALEAREYPEMLEQAREDAGEDPYFGERAGKPETEAVHSLEEKRTRRT